MTPRSSSSRDRALSLVRSSLVWDNHACMPLRPQDTSFLPQLQRHRAAGVDVVMLNVGFGDQGIEPHVRMLASLRTWVLAHAHEYRLIGSLADSDAARERGQLAIGFDIEGANALGGQLSMVQVYAALGVRWMSLAYNRNNLAAGGCQDEDAGLTAFGHALLREMAAAGMVACCSHTGYRSAHQAIDASPVPVVFSHSNPSAVHAHPRNIPDDLIRACAARGGVVGINGIGVFLGGNDSSVGNVVRHVAHVAGLVGAAHVGLGLDHVFDPQELDDCVAQHPQTFPVELGYGQGMAMADPSAVPSIAAGLLDVGFHEAEVRQVLGGNWRRIAETVWRRGEPE